VPDLGSAWPTGTVRADAETAALPRSRWPAYDSPVAEGLPKTTEGPLTPEELQLSTRNRGMPLEGLRYDLTPTGMHYLLIHFDVPAVDPASWRLEVAGNVKHPLSMTIDDIRGRPGRTLPVTMECAGNGRARLTPRPVSQPWLVEAVGTAEWTGAPLRELLAEAGVKEDTVDLVFTGADHGTQGDVEHDYARSLPPEDAMGPDVLLAYEMNGRPLEPQHGAPLRLVVPGWYGMASVKWLTRIQAVTEPFEGYQQALSYRYQRSEEDAGEPVTRIRVRALMIPPGHPDFHTRHRFVDAGTVQLTGRAWSGLAPITRVEVGVYDSWEDAKVEPALGEFAWSSWSYEWDARPGEHVLSCRATDAQGNTQPMEQPWNLHGYGNNLVQRVQVTVR
jgi:DMSO/TMAO reductase YedYZ molybdopterin-dependent catalytic subunit